MEMPVSVLNARRLPSGDQASARTPRIAAGSSRCRPAPFAALPQTVPSSRSTNAIVEPSGDQAGATPSTATSVRLPPAVSTTVMPPAWESATASRRPLGDQLGLSSALPPWSAPTRASVRPRASARTMLPPPRAAELYASLVPTALQAGSASGLAVVDRRA